MSLVQFIDGAQRNVPLTNVSSLGEEGERTATAHYDGKEYEVYQNPVDGNTTIWYEQLDYETFKMLEGAKKGFVEADNRKEVDDLRDKAYINFMDNPDRWDDMQEYERWQEENHRE